MKGFFIKSYNGFVFLIWIMLVCLFLFQYITQVSFPEAILFSISVFLPTSLLTFYLSNNLLPKAIRNKNMNRFIIQFIIITLLTGVIHLITFTTFEKLEEIKVFETTELMRTRYPLIVEYMLTLPAIVVINLGFCGIRFYFEHSKLQEEHLKTQLQILQNQINPHFMFNVLNHIYILMQKDVELSSHLLVKYSEILRYQLYNGKREFSTLGEEIQFLKDVIDVEKMRWGKELNIDCKWSIENSEKEIQPLILFTLIENAFKHVSRSISETGYINIVFEQQGDSLYMEVENSKSTQQVKKKDSSGLGLKNAKERLKILYPNKHKLQIKETEQIYIIQLNITL
jgi:hypothetical protein